LQRRWRRGLSLVWGSWGKNVPRELKDPSRCGWPRPLLLRSISENSWRGRRRSAAHSCDLDFLAATRFAWEPGEAKRFRVVVNLTSVQANGPQVVSSSVSSGPVGCGPGPPAGISRGQAPRRPIIAAIQWLAAGSIRTNATSRTYQTHSKSTDILVEYLLRVLRLILTLISFLFCLSEAGG